MSAIGPVVGDAVGLINLEASIAPLIKSFFSTPDIGLGASVGAICPAKLPKPVKNASSML